MRPASLSLLLLAITLPALAGRPNKRPVDTVEGKQLWDRSCWYCHGEANDGQGPAAGALVGGVPDLRGAITPKRYDALAQLVMDGSPEHPAFSTELDKHQARRILIYLEKLERDRQHPPPADTPPADTPPPGGDEP